MSEVIVGKEHCFLGGTLVVLMSILTMGCRDADNEARSTTMSSQNGVASDRQLPGRSRDASVDSGVVGDSPGPALRLQALTVSPEKLKIRPSDEFPRVYGVVTDWTLSGGSATIVALSDGNASLYTTGTFGIIGGYAHDSVRAAAKEVVRASEKLFEHARPTSEFPLPDLDHMRFYLLCFDGVRVIDGEVEKLPNNQDLCSDLWWQVHLLITELREISGTYPHP